MTERSTADEEIMRAAMADDDATDPPPEAKTDDTLELGGDDAPEVKDEEQPDGKKRNHRPWHQRVDILTARLRDAEHRAATAEARAGGTDNGPAAEQAPDPNAKNDDGSDKYEFGEADPSFLKDIARFEVRQTLKEEREKAAEEDQKTTAQRELTGRLESGVASIEKAGPEKYDDFETKINEAIEARGGEPLHPMVSIGIAVSPAGADIAYRLATDEAAATKIEKLAQSNPQQAAIAFGELEGQYLESEDDEDLDPSDPLDMARMLGRERARRKGLNVKQATVKTTKAAAPERTARGGNGQFEVSDDTDDFGAFERKYMGKKG